MIDLNTLVGAIGAVAAAVAALIGVINRRKIKTTDAKVEAIPPKLAEIHVLVNSKLDDVVSQAQLLTVRGKQLEDTLKDAGVKIPPFVVGLGEPLPPAST